MFEWNIQSRAHACQVCGREFQDRESLHTVLFDERQEFLRQDVCEGCWQSQFGEGANHRRGFVSHWQTVYEPPPASPPEPIQKETAETLLRKLLGQNDPTHAGAVFILAVMLERKRLLKVKGQATQEGRRILVYEHAKTGDVLTIPDPELQLDQLESVQRDVAHLLEHGLEVSPAPVVAAPADPAAMAAAETPYAEPAPPPVAAPAP